MSGIRHGISTSEITWEKAESQIQFSETNEVTISVVGSVGVGSGVTSLDDAIQLLPSTVPLSNDGPIGNCSRYSGARITAPGAKYLGDDTIQVTADYIIAVPANEFSQGGAGDGTSSDSDRAQRTIVVEDAPILTHPLVEQFDATDRVLLRALLNGDIKANPMYLDGGTGRQIWEFIRPLEDGVKIEQVSFGATNQTVAGVTSNALEFARLIVSGVTVWRRPTVRHTLIKSRNEPAPNSEYEKVGDAIAGTPDLAPSITTDDKQWFVNGITDSTENGQTWQTQYEYELSGPGGILKALYKGGTAEITT